MNSYRTYEMKSYLRAVRVAVGLTQKELALLLGTSRNTISQIERNEYLPSAYLAALICETLNVPFEKMFYWEYEGVKAPIYVIHTDKDKIARHMQYLRNEAEFRKGLNNG